MTGQFGNIAVAGLAFGVTSFILTCATVIILLLVIFINRKYLEPIFQSKNLSEASTLMVAGVGKNMNASRELASNTVYGIVASIVKYSLIFSIAALVFSTLGWISVVIAPFIAFAGLLTVLTAVIGTEISQKITKKKIYSKDYIVVKTKFQRFTAAITGGILIACLFMAAQAVIFAVSAFTFIAIIAAIGLAVSTLVTTKKTMGKYTPKKLILGGMLIGGLFLVGFMTLLSFGILPLTAVSGLSLLAFNLIFVTGVFSLIKRTKTYGRIIEQHKKAIDPSRAVQGIRAKLMVLKNIILSNIGIFVSGFLAMVSLAMIIYVTGGAFAFMAMLGSVGILIALVMFIVYPFAIHYWPKGTTTVLTGMGTGGGLASFVYQRTIADTSATNITSRNFGLNDDVLVDWINSLIPEEYMSDLDKAKSDLQEAREDGKPQEEIDEKEAEVKNQEAQQGVDQAQRRSDGANRLAEFFRNLEEGWEGIPTTELGGPFFDFLDGLVELFNGSIESFLDMLAASAELDAAEADLALSYARIDAASEEDEENIREQEQANIDDANRRYWEAKKILAEHEYAFTESTLANADIREAELRLAEMQLEEDKADTSTDIGAASAERDQKQADYDAEQAELDRLREEGASPEEIAAQQVRVDAARAELTTAQEDYNAQLAIDQVAVDDAQEAYDTAVIDAAEEAIAEGERELQVAGFRLLLANLKADILLGLSEAFDIPILADIAADAEIEANNAEIAVANAEIKIANAELASANNDLEVASEDYWDTLTEAEKEAFIAEHPEFAGVDPGSSYADLTETQKQICRDEAIALDSTLEEAILLAQQKKAEAELAIVQAQYDSAYALLDRTGLQEDRDALTMARLRLTVAEENLDLANEKLALQQGTGSELDVATEEVQLLEARLALANEQIKNEEIPSYTSIILGWQLSLAQNRLSTLTAEPEADIRVAGEEVVEEEEEEVEEELDLEDEEELAETRTEAPSAETEAAAPAPPPPSPPEDVELQAPDYILEQPPAYIPEIEAEEEEKEKEEEEEEEKEITPLDAATLQALDSAPTSDAVVLLADQSASFTAEEPETREVTVTQTPQEEMTDLYMAQTDDGQLFRSYVDYIRNELGLSLFETLDYLATDEYSIENVMAQAEFYALYNVESPTNDPQLTIYVDYLISEGTFENFIALARDVASEDPETYTLSQLQSEAAAFAAPEEEAPEPVTFEVPEAEAPLAATEAEILAAAEAFWDELGANPVAYAFFQTYQPLLAGVPPGTAFADLSLQQQEVFFGMMIQDAIVATTPTSYWAGVIAGSQAEIDQFVIDNGLTTPGITNATQFADLNAGDQAIVTALAIPIGATEYWDGLIAFDQWAQFVIDNGLTTPGITESTLFTDLNAGDQAIVIAVFTADPVLLDLSTAYTDPVTVVEDIESASYLWNAILNEPDALNAFNNLNGTSGGGPDPTPAQVQALINFLYPAGQPRIIY
ncbi:hypothetical protein ACFL58_04740, partial [Elusimicrobiota bacterium]